jgi:hypothetical protein
MKSPDRPTGEDTREEASGPKNPLAVPASKYGIEINPPSPLLQKHLEDFQKSMRIRTNDESYSPAQVRSFTVKIAIELGWLTGLDALDVAGTHAGKIAWAYAVLANYIEEAQAPPPN